MILSNTVCAQNSVSPLKRGEMLLLEQFSLGFCQSSVALLSQVDDEGVDFCFLHPFRSHPCCFLSALILCQLREGRAIYKYFW